MSKGYRESLWSVRNPVTEAKKAPTDLERIRAAHAELSFALERERARCAKLIARLEALGVDLEDEGA